MYLTPKITVYIPSHNYGLFVKKSIDSVFSQTIENWELILINDGSSDNTQSIFEEYRHDPRVSIYKVEGLGLPKVSNLALNKAKGKYIIRLDGDDFFEENILLVLSNYLDRMTECALVFPDYYLIDEYENIYSHEWRRKINVQDKLLDEPPNGACTMVRTSVLKEVGGYRDDLGAQDGLDLWLKLKNKFKAINVNLPLFYYRRHGKNLTEQPIKIINARRALKKDRYRMAVNQIKPIIAVIPCREKYDFVENLWDQKINNKSLLELSIDRCVESNEFDYIVICADNRNVESTVLKYRDDKRVRFLYRDPSLTVLSKGIGETLKVVQQCYDANCSGILVIVYLQTPFVSKDTIEEAISSLVISESHSAFAVEEIRHDVFLKGENGLTVIKNNLNGCINGSMLYRDTSTCVAVLSSSIEELGLRGQKAVSFPVSTAESYFIRSKLDIDIACQINREG